MFFGKFLKRFAWDLTKGFVGVTPFVVMINAQVYYGFMRPGKGLYNFSFDCVKEAAIKRREEKIAEAERMKKDLTK